MHASLILNVILVLDLIAFAIVGMALFNRNTSRTGPPPSYVVSHINRMLEVSLTLTALPLMQVHPAFGKIPFYLLGFYAVMILGKVLAAQILRRRPDFPRQILKPLGIGAAAYLVIQCIVLGVWLEPRRAEPPPSFPYCLLPLGREAGHELDDCVPPK